MNYLLDTNVVIRFINGNPDTIQLLVALARLSRAPLSVSTVTQMEVWEGVYRAADPAYLAHEYQAVFDDLTIHPFDSEVAKRGARLRYDLRQAGLRTRERGLDLQIAATALYHGLELVTYNVRDYDDIPGLDIHPL